MTAAREIEETAAVWLIRRDEADWSPGDEFEFQSWLDESYAHMSAFWRLETAWRGADRIAALGSYAASVASKRRFQASRQRWMSLAASFVIVALSLPLMLRGSSVDDPVRPVSQFRTQLGGHKQVSFADGSTIELNTQTIIRSNVTLRHRDIWLDKGEAFFSVKHLAIPFVVHAGSRLITVLGTKFSVRRDGNNVRVVVTDGRVRVSDADTSHPSPTATIDKGDILEEQGESTLLLQNAGSKVEQSLAWRDGMLEFDRTPLVEVANEFNRYNQRKLVIAGDAGSIRIGGSFKVSNVDAFARLLHDAYGLRIERTSTETKIFS